MEIKIAERIALLMKEFGLNQVQLAEKIGLKQKAYGGWQITLMWILIIWSVEKIFNNSKLIARYFHLSLPLLAGWAGGSIGNS